MAVINPPAWMQAGSYPARTDRLALSALLSYPGFAVDESTPMRIRQGVKPSYTNYQLKVRAAATPNMTVIVSGGFAFIDQHDTGGQGTYIVANDGDVIVPVAPAGGAGQYRKDTVVVSVYDGEYAGNANEARIEVIQGPYAASAGATVRGTLPKNAQVLADISIGPNQTSVAAGNIADVRNYSVAAGGIVPVRSSIAPNRLHPGQALYLTDRDEIRYGKENGDVGTIYPGLRYQNGTASLTWTTATAGTWVQVDVTFPQPFASTPIVHVTPQANAPAVGGTTTLMYAVSGVTTTGFSVRAYRSTAFSGQPFGWTAFQ
ncbi:MAG TPA: H-type lectin domain-containing protein [Micromonosporaceae bacterium]|nr:H-type lectin domain-containing protein [Micromonosporaceae bacterium]